MENNFEYYFIGPTIMPSVPLLRNDDNANPKALRFLSKSKPVETEDPIYLRFNPPIPKNPCIVDYHSLPYTVFSKKVVDVLKELDIRGVQFVPAIINSEDGEQFGNYFILHSYDRKAVFDEEKSEYVLDEDYGYWDQIKKIYLDHGALSKIPLNERLIFIAKENSRFELYHKSVVDAIMAIDPKGVHFTPVESWYDGIQFK